MRINEAVMRSLIEVATQLRDNDDMVLLLLRLADAFEDKTQEPMAAFERWQDLLAALPSTKAIIDQHIGEK